MSETQEDRYLWERSEYILSVTEEEEVQDLTTNLLPWLCREHAEISGGHNNPDNSPTSVMQTRNEAGAEDRMDDHVRDEALTAADFAREAYILEMTTVSEFGSSSSEAMEPLVLDVEDYRRTAHVLAKKEDNNRSDVSGSQDSCVGDEHVALCPEAAANSRNTRHQFLATASSTSASPFNLAAATSSSAASPFHQQETEPVIAFPVMGPFDLESAQAFPLSQNSTLSQHQERRLMGSVREEIQRGIAASFPEHLQSSSLPLRSGQSFSIRRRPPGPLMFFKRYWYFLVPLIVSLYVGTSLSILKNPEGIVPYERPAPENRMKTPRSKLPAPLSTLFGRDEDLRRLGEYLTKPGTMAALSGVSGVGKSHLANKFVHDWVAKSFKNRCGFWISAETENDVRRGYNNVLQALGTEIDEENDSISTSRLAEIVWTTLTRTSDFDWIIVFDNVPAEDSQSGEKGPHGIKHWFFPLSRGPWEMGRILFTTQSRSYQGRTVLGEIRRFDVLPLAADASIHMLLARLGKRWEGTPRKSIEAAEVLVGEKFLQGIPTAIEAAASYMNEHGLPLVEYLERINDVGVNSRAA